MKQFSVIPFLIAITLLACSKSDPSPEPKPITPPAPKPIGKSATLPTVTTRTVHTIKAQSAISGGELISDGGSAIVNRGVVWSSTKAPTIDYLTKTKNGTGNDSFTSVLSGLTQSTVYYVRAYATNSIGTGYGETLTFTSSTPKAPIVITYPPEHITQTTVTAGGKALSEEPILDRGIIWSIHNPPTLDDQKISSNLDDNKIFMHTIAGLLPETTYYLRTYATNMAGTGYGMVIPFITFSESHRDTKALELFHNWILTNVTLNKTDRTGEFDDFTLNLYGYAKQVPYGYKVNSHSAVHPWPDQGTWTFGENMEEELIRDAETMNEILMHYTLHEDLLCISFEFMEEGLWEFKFKKQ